MESRLSAMWQAANQVKPAVDDFYARLNSEQKQRFNTLQQVAGGEGTGRTERRPNKPFGTRLSPMPWVSPMS
jgi:hypothetical protein